MLLSSVWFQVAAAAAKSLWLVFKKSRADSGASLVAQLVKKQLAMQETLVRFLGQEDPLEEGQAIPTLVFLGFTGGSDGKEYAYNVGDLGWIPGLGRSPEGGYGNTLQHSCLENPCGQRSLAGLQRVRHH